MADPHASHVSAQPGLSMVHVSQAMGAALLAAAEGYGAPTPRTTGLDAAYRASRYAPHRTAPHRTAPHRTAPQATKG